MIREVGRGSDVLDGTTFYRIHLLISSNSPPPRFQRQAQLCFACWPWLFQTTACSYTVKQRCLNKRKVRSAISATAGLLDIHQATLFVVPLCCVLSQPICISSSLV